MKRHEVISAVEEVLGKFAHGKATSSLSGQGWEGN